MPEPIRYCDTLREALEESAKGHIALHVWKPTETQRRHAKEWWFRKTYKWGHLLCQDEERLRAIARTIGIHRVFIDRHGERGQHLDLCGKALNNAILRSGHHPDDVPGEESNDRSID